MDSVTPVTSAETRQTAPTMLRDPHAQSSMFAGKDMKTEGLRTSELDIAPTKTTMPSPSRIGARNPVYLWSPTRETKPQVTRPRTM